MTTTTLHNQARPRNRIRESRADQIFNFINYSILTVVLIVILYPLIYVVSASVSDGAAVISGRVILWPVDFSLAAYVKIFEYKRVWMGYGNTIFYTFFGTILNVLMTLIAAYPLSRRDLYGKNIFLGLFVFTLCLKTGSK